MASSVLVQSGKASWKRRISMGTLDGGVLCLQKLASQRGRSRLACLQGTVSVEGVGLHSLSE